MDKKLEQICNAEDGVGVGQGKGPYKVDKPSETPYAEKPAYETDEKDYREFFDLVSSLGGEV